MKRRDFLSHSTKGTLGLCCIGLSQSFLGCAGVPYVGFQKKANLILIDLSVLEDDSKFLLDVESVEAPIMVIKGPGGGFTSLLMLCTHKACTLRPAGPVLLCPCHGSEFNLGGDVLKGPAERNLISFPVLKEGNTLKINIE